ncbi:hypothetical protein DKX38_013402 [Salix brachista]|uniref:FH2 domain-containing protein n=1 Tax=Salix brachista TaxID=2182728 RepID=A0A5N5LRI8_9ROSI|nr:hypothetical protein DKX38_013402 [Salix brachista]
MVLIPEEARRWRLCMPSRAPFSRVEGNVKGVVGDESGLDVLSWRKHHQFPLSAINLSTLGWESRPLKNQKQSQPSNPPLTQSPTPPPQSSMAIANKQVPAPPPPPKHQPPKAAGLAASSNLPPFHKSESGGSSTALGSTIAGTRNGQVKVKSLHWDKVDKNTGHSWCGTKSMVARLAQIVILDARKSKNMAMVLKSLSISRNELLDALTNGHGLNADTLEKLMRIAPTKEESQPTKEEESQILESRGNPTRLADTESFLFYLLKAVPLVLNSLM